jgi:hypothetical protein
MAFFRTATVVLAASASLSACKKDPPPPAAKEAVVDGGAPSPPAALDAGSSYSPITGGLTRLDCAGIAPFEPPGACRAAPRPTDALIHASEQLAELFGMHHPPTPEWWEPARAAVTAARDVDPKAMTLAERISVQNAALHIAVSAKDDLARDALRIVDRLAFTPAERDAALAQTVDLSPWLGPSADRMERTKSEPFLHETAAHETRIFRLVKTPRLRANFSELIAVDTEGAPFATAVVGSIEIRKGRGLEAPACVALQSPDRLRCGLFAGLREPGSLNELPGGHFLRRDEHGHLRCNDCHGPEGDSPVIGALDVDPESVAFELARHRRTTIARLRALLDPLRR